MPISRIEQDPNNSNAFSIKTVGIAGAIDAFGRTRTSQPYTLADYKNVYGEESELLTVMSGAGASKTIRRNEASARLAVGTQSGEFVTYQSRMYHNYMPGKSQLVFNSFVMGQPNSGTNKRVGLFDDRNGIYFQQSGNGQLQIVKRDFISGFARETVVPQSQWNIDACNGYGNSNFNLDITKTQLFTTDFQWLGVGRIRAGFVHDGNIIVAHEFYHSNNLPTVYWSNPSLPIRAEIKNYSSADSSNAYMDQICATVISEGGYSEAGMDFSVCPSGVKSIAASSSSPVLAIRLATGFYNYPNRNNVRLQKATYSTIDQNTIYEIWRLPSSTSVLGGSWLQVNDQSAVEYNTAATGVILTSGARIDCGFLAAGGNGANSYMTSTSTASISDARQGYLAQNIDSSDSNIFLILMKNLSSSSATNTFGSFQWRESR